MRVFCGYNPKEEGGIGLQEASSMGELFTEIQALLASLRNQRVCREPEMVIDRKR
jgi:hypothetical protein